MNGFPDFSQTLRQFESELQKIGLSRGFNRLTALIRRVEEGIAVKRYRGPKERAKLNWHYIEGTQWYTIFRTLGEELSIYRSKLREALKGTEHLIEENKNNSMARDTLFELLVLSICRKAGLPAQLYDDAGPDIRIDVSGTAIVAVECKRPSSIDAVDNLMRKAVVQSQDEAIAGVIVAVDLTAPFFKLVSPDDGDEVGDRVPSAETVRQIQGAMGARLEQYVRDSVDQFGRLERESKVLANLIYAAYPFWVEGVQPPSIGETIRLKSYDRSQSANRLRELVLEPIRESNRNA